MIKKILCFFGFHKPIHIQRGSEIYPGRVYGHLECEWCGKHLDF